MTETWLRALFLACVFGAVLLAVEVIVGSLASKRTQDRAINLRLKMIGQGRRRDETLKLLRRSTSALPVGLPPTIAKFARRMELLLVRAQVTVPTSRLLIALLLAPLLLFFLIIVVMLATTTPVGFGRLVLVGAFSIAAGGLVPIMGLQFLANRSRKKIQDQFPVAIDVFVRGLRAGHPVAAALDLLTVEMPDPIGSEFGIVVDEVTYGADLRDALHAMAERWDLDDMRMFVVSLSVQNETGGNLAEILENLSTVIRERASMMMKVRALSSEGRMTAIMLTILPVAAFVMLFLLSPSFYLDVADDPAFVPGFVGMLLSYGIGVFWIRKLVDLKV